MAYGSSGDDDYHLGIFSMINGVHVKIAEKYKPPERISLPVGWRPSDPSQLLGFEYNFWKENEVISKAEEERITQVQMRNNSAKEANEASPAEPAVNMDSENECADEDSPNTSNDSNVNEILTPLMGTPSDGKENKSDDTQNKINVEEFEDQNQNPFELVELQTLDEYDELRCVLEPSAKGKKVIKSNKEPGTYENFELDANFFKNVNIAQPVPSLTSENHLLNLDNQVNVSMPVKTGKEEFNIPMHTAKGTLNWTKFNKDTLPRSVGNQSVGQNMDQQPQSMSNMMMNGQVTYNVASNQNNIQAPNSNPNEQNPAMMPYPVSSGTNIGGMSLSQSVPLHSETENNEHNAIKPNLSYGQLLFMGDNTPRTKSMPDLVCNTDKMFHPGNETTSPVSNNPIDLSNQQRPNIDQSQVDNVVRTDRIDSIMKQYQFQRLHNGPPTTNSNPPNCSSTSNVGMNLPQYPGGYPGYPPNTVSTNVNGPTESFPQSVSLPYSIQDPSAGIQCHMASNVIFNQPNTSVLPANSMPPPVLNRNQPITSNYQGIPENNVRGVPAPNMNLPYPSDTNPFVPSNNPSNSQIPISAYRHGILPPLPIERPPLIDSFNRSLQQPPQIYDTNYSIPALPKHPSPLLPPIESQETTGPPISPHNNLNGMTSAPPSAPEKTSWLVDPTEDLPSNQKNFAYQISAMGFSLPCVSRTVLRLGMDEKEVLDFLCSVQDLKEKDFHSDDVEMALLNMQNEKEKVSSYLQMVTTLKELGFKPSEIHNALVQTSVDQNKAIDYLTSSR